MIYKARDRSGRFISERVKTTPLQGIKSFQEGGKTPKNRGESGIKNPNFFEDQSARLMSGVAGVTKFLTSPFKEGKGFSGEESYLSRLNKMAEQNQQKWQGRTNSKYNPSFSKPSTYPAFIMEELPSGIASAPIAGPVFKYLSKGLRAGYNGLKSASKLKSRVDDVPKSFIENEITKGVKLDFAHKPVNYKPENFWQPGELKKIIKHNGQLERDIDDFMKSRYPDNPAENFFTENAVDEFLNFFPKREGFIPYDAKMGLSADDIKFLNIGDLDINRSALQRYAIAGSTRGSTDRILPSAVDFKNMQGFFNQEAANPSTFIREMGHLSKEQVQKLTGEQRKELANILMNQQRKIFQGRMKREISTPARLSDMREMPINREGGKLIQDQRGQWAHPGKPTQIQGEDITMKGVPYPVLALSDNGQKEIMLPGKEYHFAGAKHVNEFPLMRKGGSVGPRFSMGSAGGPGKDPTYFFKWSFGNQIKSYPKSRGRNSFANLGDHNTQLLINKLSQFKHGGSMTLGDTSTNKRNLLKQGVGIAKLYPLPFKKGGKMAAKKMFLGGLFQKQPGFIGTDVDVEAGFQKPGVSPMRRQQGGNLPTSFGQIGNRMKAAYQTAPPGMGVGAGLFSGVKDVTNIAAEAFKYPFVGDNFKNTLNFAGNKIQGGLRTLANMPEPVTPMKPVNGMPQVAKGGVNAVRKPK